MLGQNISIPSPYQFPPVLALLPSLLKFSCDEIVCKSAEIVGAASLASFEMNEQIVSEDEIVKSLISLLPSSKREIAVAACNAVLDVSTTSIGRQRLFEFGAIENLLLVQEVVSSDLTSTSLCILQESKSRTAAVGLDTDKTWLEEDEYRKLLLQGATALINSCTIEQLKHVPLDFSEKILVLLKGLWAQDYKQRLYSSSSRYQANEIYVSSIRANNLVESIFRLSINHCLQEEFIDIEHVQKYIFDMGEASIKPFLSEVWETSPMLIRNASKYSLTQSGIFSPFLHYLGSKEAIPSILPSMLKYITSCPAIASDELDIVRVIEEIRNHLGYPIIYNQDIRVVKTQLGEVELHYLEEHLESTFSMGPQILSVSDILKCEEAFKEGYTIAIRGMEFRYHTISSIADGLASLFGQPSAGVNMYLTPSNSQGLARHSDDHCVFICQLIGVKRWTIFSQPDFQLPRLYESSYGLQHMKDESLGAHGHQQIMLKEGDILYIPRGFPHEAITVLDEDEDANNATGFSLHLTLAVEIESPFEWEGFMHVALYSWDIKQKALHHKSEESVQRSLQSVSVRILHVAIKLVGNLYPAFRKACLVGAMPLSSDTRDWIRTNQKTTFAYLISKITSESKFSDAVSHIEAVLQKNEDPLEHIRWMKYLTMEGEGPDICQSSSTLSGNSRHLLDILIQHRDMAEAAFVQVKSNFCNKAEFDDAEEHYKVLLEKYRKVRKQYTNGMLSIHSALLNEHEFSLS